MTASAATGTPCRRPTPTTRGRPAARFVLGQDTTPAQRVDALVALIDASGQHLYSADELFAAALRAAAGRCDLTARILIRQSVWANVNEGDPHRACALAGRATAFAESAGDTTTALSVKTGEATLTRKLGLRSRFQLAHTVTPARE
ncbi:hypothetical protein [Streptomyces sp. NPDC001108]